MTIVMCACCETAVQDVRTNNISLINLIDELSAVSFPVAVPKLTLVTVFDRKESEPETLHLRLRAALNEDSLFDIAFTPEFQGKLRTRAVAEFQGVIIPAAGQLHIGVVSEELELAGWDILVRAVGAPQVDLFSAPRSSSGDTAPS